MVDQFEQGVTWLVQQFKDHLSRSVVYVRTAGIGAGEITILAAIGRTEHEQTDEHGQLRQMVTRDYIFPTADLVLAGAVRLPEPGDQIKETIAGVTKLFEVLAVPGGPAWRYNDQYQFSLRVHTKYIGDVA